MTNTATKSSVMKSALILVLGAFVAMLDTTMTNIGINTILNDLHSTVNTMQWVTTAYVLALGLTVAFAGWLIDAFSGKKSKFLRWSFSWQVRFYRELLIQFQFC